MKAFFVYKENQGDTALIQTQFTRQFECVDTQDKADIIISFGGDGTFLRAAQIAFEHDLPCLAFHNGNFGFIPPFESIEQYFSLSHDEISTQMIPVGIMTLESGRKEYFFNDIVVQSSKMMSAYLSWGNESYAIHANGYVISLPLGSTGYALSNQGALMDLECPIFQVTQIASHDLTYRPFLIPFTQPITSFLPSDTSLFFDAQSIAIDSENIMITTAEKYLKLLVPKGISLTERLRDRFFWNEKTQIYNSKRPRFL